LKSIDLMVRPIRYRKEDGVKAHTFLCILAYYAQWHMLQAWAPLLFADQQLPEMRKVRDPIMPATTSESAKDKKATRQTQDGLPVHSFASLMGDLATGCGSFRFATITRIYNRIDSRAVCTSGSDAGDNDPATS
jgi:hypothetical protein